MVYQQMTKERWLEQVTSHGKELRELIADYHPAARIQRFTRDSMVITAPNAEAACENVRESIRNKETEDPLVKWDKAVAEGNVEEIMSLLDGAWFGVPESTECWNIPGFSKAVDLLDDPPE